MTLQERIKNTKFIYFANPLSYSCKYYPNHINILKKSDFDYFKPYIRAARSDKESKLGEELKSLNGDEYRTLFIFDDHYNTIVDDDIVSDYKALDKLFRTEHDVIIGPEVNYNDHTYKHIEGCSSDRLDIFGDKIDEVNFRFFPSNHVYLGDQKHYLRSVEVGDDQGETEHVRLTIFQKKTYGMLIGLYNDEDGEYYDDVSHYFNDEGNLDEEGGLVFVNDLDDNEEIVTEINEWIDDYMEEFSDELSYIEDDAHSNIKYENPIRYGV
jgi:hypothetical protein